jgi:hypothetical protein
MSQVTPKLPNPTTHNPYDSFASFVRHRTLVEYFMGPRKPMVRCGRMGCSISSLSRELVNVTDCGRLQPDQGRAWPPGGNTEAKEGCHPAAESRSGTCRGRPEVGLRLKSALSGEGYFALVLAMERRQWRDAGPSQFDPSKPALGPTEAPKAAVRYVR